MTEPNRDAEAIFFAALDKTTPQGRVAYVEATCVGDPELLRRVRELLSCHEGSQGLLDAPPPGLACTVDPSEVSERPGTVIGPYKLLQQIGEGGMGTVYMAEQTRPVQRKVALKVIKPGMDTRQVIARFEAERQALAMMDHVNIARVLDAGATDSGRPYFVMELVHGVPITKYCDDNHMTPRERLELFVPVCQAIQHAHQKGIIHRDIKPSNVMITLYDGKPVPKVIDFGVAKATEQKLTERTLFTQYGTMVGTLEYMSPEQAEMSALGVDTRSDIYSLGVLLYELLTGSTPLSHKRVREAAYGEILRMIKEEEPPRPSTRLSDSGEALASISAQRHMEPAKLTKLVRGELDWIVMKTLEKDRNRRYETANGLAADLRHYLVDEPVQACPPSAMYRLRKFARRNKGLLTTAGLLALALIVGTVVSTWQAIRASRAERQIAAALADAQRQRGEAGRKAAEAQAVVDFLVNDMIASASPIRTMGRTITVEDTLARADETIGVRFASQPLVEAAIRHTMGWVYRHLGRRTKAERHSRRAVELRREHLGPEHPDTLQAMFDLAQVLSDEKALTLYRQIVDARLRALGPQHHATLDAEAAIAWLLCRLGRLEEAQALFERVNEAQRRALGEEHFETVGSLHGLAWVLYMRRDLERAEALFRLVLDTKRRTLGENHIKTLWAMREFSRVLRAQGKLDEAMAMSEESLQRYELVCGPFHPDTNSTLFNLLEGLRLQGRRDDCQSICEQRLARLMGTAVEPDLDLREVRAGHLASLVWQLLTVADPTKIDIAACVRPAEQAVELKPNDGDIWKTLGVARYRAGDWKAAAVALAKSNELLCGNKLAFNAFFLAMAHWQLGDKPQARSWYDKAVEWMEKNRPKDEELIRFRAEATALLGVKEKKN